MWKSEKKSGVFSKLQQVSQINVCLLIEFHVNYYPQGKKYGNVLNFACKNVCEHSKIALPSLACRNSLRPAVPLPASARKAV